ncbi:hypothetical protein V8C34DRAFT_318782 [Trichoderma compactum]
MADGETMEMQPDCDKGLTVDAQASPDISNDGHEDLHNDPRQSEPYQQLLITAEFAASTDVAPIGHNSIISEEIRGLREQIHLLQMKASVDSLNAKRKSRLSRSELRRIKDYLRKHRKEWDLEASLNEISLEPVIEHLQNSAENKEMASGYLMFGDEDEAAEYLANITSDDEDDFSDEEQEELRRRLRIKRREHLKAMELGVESITEDLVMMRLRKMLQKQQMAAELKREAKLKAAEKRERGNDRTTTTETREPETIAYAEPKANLVDWTLFKGLGRQTEGISCVLDVLVGEPVVEKESWGYNWNRRDRPAETSQAQKQNATSFSTGPRVQGPLPERIRIHSNLFLRIFAKLIDPDGVKLNLGTSSVVFLRPFKAITHYEDRLRDWLTRRQESIESQDGKLDPAGESNDNDKELESPTAMAHLKCVLEFFDAHIAARIAFLQSFECLIGLDGKQAYRVIQVTSSRHRPISNRRFYYNYAYKIKDDDESEPSEFTLHCSYIDFDGKYIGPVLRTFEIKRFDGERDITSLEVYPLRFHKLKQSEFNFTQRNELENIPEHDRCRANLIQRGAKFVQVAAVKHMYYSGPTMIVREEVESQVVVDFATCFAAEGEIQEHIKRPSLESFIGEAVEGKDNQESSVERCECCLFDTVYEDDKFVDKNLRNDYVNNILSSKGREEPPSVAICPRPFDEMKTASGDDPTFSEEELVIMSYRVFGFVLRNRKWAQLDLTYLTEVREPTPIGPIDDQRTEGGKSGNDNETAFDQLVLESGHKDMIISLITQHFQDKKAKGAQMEQVDIVRGKGKGLILLLHGAPGVGKTSTAAFLRVLEYYAGILFLTTNRIGDFDEAFTSRIHISLYYPELNKKKTVDIFKLNLDLIQNRFKRMKRVIQIDYEGIERFAKMHYLWYYDSRWNGRQIRNACQTALALAEYQAQKDSKSTGLESETPVKLTVNYFEIVRNAYLEFTKYLVDLYGASTARVAEERYLRAKETSNRGELIYTTEQLYEMLEDGIRPENYRPSSLQQKPSYDVHSSREAGRSLWEEQPGKSQNARSMRDRNQTEPSSTSKASRAQRLLRPERVGPSPRPSPNSYRQRNAPPPPDVERESSSRGYGNHQRSKREPQASLNPDSFGEDDNDDEYFWQRRQNQRQQGLDEMSEEEQGYVDGSDNNFEEQSAETSSRGRREQANSRYAGRQK